jgi:hypothetical protein
MSERKNRFGRQFKQASSMPTSNSLVVLTIPTMLAVISMVNPGQCFDKVTQSGAAPRAATIKLSDFAKPESGLKLLNGIFSRLSQPQLAQKNDGRQLLAENKMALRQIAMANNSMQAAKSQFSGGLAAASHESTDPALAIRPQAARRLSVGRTAIDRVIPIEGITIAMAPPSPKVMAKKGTAGAGGASGASSTLGNNNGLAGKDDLVQSAPSAAPSSAAPAIAGMPASPSQALQKTMDADEKPAKKAEMPQRSEPQQKSGFTNGMLMAQNSPYIRDYRQSSQSNAINWRGNAAVTTKQLNEEVESRRDSSATENGIIRPAEQPGLFKYVREHLKELPKDIPADAGKNSADLKEKEALATSQAQSSASADVFGSTDKLTASQSRARGKEKPMADSERDIALEGKDGSAVQIAFLPPNTVHGLNGLPLGATEDEVSRFLKNKGSLSKASVSGWKIWTLSDNKLNPLIQVYLRAGRAEAYRIYNQSYVPAGLGLALSDELSLMKSKFGEPSFILEEPGVRSVVAKNYVYPVSQVSFQLVRTGAGSAPQILSLMLFRYL